MYKQLYCQDCPLLPLTERPILKSLNAALTGCVIEANHIAHTKGNFTKGVMSLFGRACLWFILSSAQ